MAWVPALIVILQGIAFIAFVIIIIFLVIRRLDIRDKEDFEKRDN